MDIDRDVKKQLDKFRLIYYELNDDLASLYDMQTQTEDEVVYNYLEDITLYLDNGIEELNRLIKKLEE